MQRTFATGLGALAAALLAGPASSAAPAFTFDVAQLAGEWAENFTTGEACHPDNLHFKLEVTPDKDRLNVLFDRKWVTAAGQVDRMSATILSSSAHALVIRYDNETRKLRSGQVIEWELAIVAPGVYRWRSTDWPEGEVNTVVGVRCSPRS